MHARKKKILLLVLILTLVFANNAVAQKDDEKRSSFDRNNAIGLAGGIQPVRVYDGISYTPAFILNYEHVTINMLGPGVLSIGAEFSIYKVSYADRPNTIWYKKAYSARAIYYLTILKDKIEGLDPYGGLAAGIYSSSLEERSYDYSERYKSDVFLAPFIGVKYNFTPGFGLWAEGGYDITVAKLGMNFNF